MASIAMNNSTTDNGLSDYIAYKNYQDSIQESESTIEQILLMKQENEFKVLDLEIPPRSPRRPFGMKNFNHSNTSITSCEVSSMSDSGSISDKTYNSDCSSDSIFSNYDMHVVSRVANPQDSLGLEENELNALLQEIEVNEDGDSNVVFCVDEIVTIVGFHTGEKL